MSKKRKTPKPGKANTKTVQIGWKLPDDLLRDFKALCDSTKRKRRWHYQEAFRAAVKLFMRLPYFWQRDLVENFADPSLWEELDAEIRKIKPGPDRPTTDSDG